jgi:DNA-binding NtrC family response regulator
MSRPRLLVIDDESNFVASLVYGLSAHGIEGFGVTTAAEGLAAVRERKPDILLLDQRLPDGLGIDLIAPIRAIDSKLRIVMISAHGDIPTAVEAVKRGAADFISKPFDLEDVVTLVNSTSVSTANVRVRMGIPESDSTAALVGISAVISELRSTITIVGRSSARTILLLGPSGAGKGLAARAIHEVSSRAGKPFTAINCASLPGDLLEAELFGVERGAYTGATHSRPGLVEAAQGGTLFLDEIAEMPASLQAKLLHFLESRLYRRLGANREHAADVRVLAASNHDLPEEVASGRFRADLFYRLNVVPIALPPLHARREDVMVLANHFAARAAMLEGVGPIIFSEAAAAALTAYDWPGNVRELANLVERLTILHPGETITPAQLPPEISGGDGKIPMTIEARLAASERDMLVRALRAANGHKGRAAEALGVSRHALKRRLKRVGLL